MYEKFKVTTNAVYQREKHNATCFFVFLFTTACVIAIKTRGPSAIKHRAE